MRGYGEVMAFDRFKRQAPRGCKHSFNMKA